MRPYSQDELQVRRHYRRAEDANRARHGRIAKELLLCLLFAGGAALIVWFGT